MEENDYLNNGEPFCHNCNLYESYLFLAFKNVFNEITSVKNQQSDSLHDNM